MDPHTHINVAMPQTVADNNTTQNVATSAETVAAVDLTANAECSPVRVRALLVKYLILHSGNLALNENHRQQIFLNWPIRI